jgi:FAD:protein FMN transferase
MTFHSVSFEAIGVTSQVTVTAPGVLDAAAGIARAELAELDRACSRFRDDSELAALNRAGARGLAVSPLLYEAVRTAIGAAAATGGLVDPTVGPALRGLGYDRDYDVLVRLGGQPAFTLVPAAGWRAVKLDDRHRVVRLRRGAELDLGATAKALSADRIAQAVRAATGADVLVGLGGDIAVCGAPADGWPVLIGDDHRQAAGGQTVALRAGGLATSSTTVRRWRAGNVELHHIVDPRTGASAPEVWRTVTVAAASCVDANAAATASVVLGAEAPAWLESLGLAARLVRPDGSVSVTCGWPEDRGAAALSGSSQGEARSLQPVPAFLSGKPTEAETR